MGYAVHASYYRFIKTEKQMLNHMVIGGHIFNCNIKE